MAKLLPIMKRCMMVLISSLLMTASGAPMSVFADAAPCTPPSNSQPGVHQPVGADAAAYTYNCDTGLWESAHFTFDPYTTNITAKDSVVYIYDAPSSSYKYAVWIYDAPTGNYVQNIQSVSQPPAGATVVGGPTTISNTGNGSTNTINNDGGVTSGSSINGTGNGSTNTIDGAANNNGLVNDTTNATMNNNITALATTGNATVFGNTWATNASTGNAQDIANIVNMLQSSSNALNGNTVTFVANIDGDVNGDLLFDPAMLGATQPALAPQVGNNNLVLNNTVNAEINNTIDLTANSGNASVDSNTNAGDATSGNAKTIANVVNLINSAITSGNSFLGVVNINGNLNGDILLPPDLIDQLLAANVPTVSIDTTGANSTNAITTQTGSNTSHTTNNNDLGITNNVTAGATTGNASVTGNTTAGNAASGNTRTNITAFNLTGSNVIGSNAILVFVNVTGTWVGMIVNAPPGTTAAALGGGVANTSGLANNNSTTNNNFRGRINNDITTSANSGDATVTKNTNAGNARSGDAAGAVNLLNVENSNLALNGWFGILFINVFGSWNGSFGVNTAAGDPVRVPVAGFIASGLTPGGTNAPFMSFSPSSGSSAGAQTGVATSTSSSTATTTPTVLAASVPVKAITQPRSNNQTQVSKRNYTILIATVLLTFAYITYEFRAAKKN